MTHCSKFVLFIALVFMYSVSLLAQHTGTGTSPAPSAPSAASKGVKSPKPNSTAISGTLVGPVYPPPLGVSFTSPGAPGIIGRAGGQNWFLSNDTLSQYTTVYWGPANDDVSLSFTGAIAHLNFNPDSSELANGIMKWFGNTQYILKDESGAGYVGTEFILTATDSITGSPVPLVLASNVGIPSYNGAVVTFSPSLHLRVNMQMLAGGIPALDFFDSYAYGPYGAQSSFGAGFYYINVPPTISAIGNQSVVENTATPSIPFKVGDLAQPTTSLVVTARSSNQTLIPNGNLALAGTDSNRTITVTPAANQLGTDTVTVEVFDGTDSTFAPFVVTVVPPIQFHVSPASLAYGNVLVGTGVTDSVVVTNPGSGTLHISSITSSDGAFSPTVAADSVPGFSGKTFYITYHPSAAVPNAGKIYFVHDAPTSPDSISVSGNGVVQIVVQKRQDGDGNPATTGDQTQKRWHLSLYQTSVSPANLLASGDTSDLVVPGLSSGTYIAVEADSGLAWHRINGNLTQSDTVSVSTTAQTIVTFVNFRPNSLAVSSLEDNDGNFGTTPDQTAKTWHLEIHQGSPSGPIVALGDTSVITAASLGDGTYYAVEADSTGWIHLGYDQNGTPVSSPGMNSIPVVLAGGADATIAFVNAPPVYSTLFRTFRQDSIAYDRDNKNALGKPVKLKPDKVDFSFQLVAPIQAVTLSLKLSITSSGVIMAGADTVASWTNAKTVTTGAIPAATLLNISGRGFSGKAMKASYVWATTPKTTKGNVTGIINVLRDPMPNRVNALFETYNRGAFTATSGLLAGRVHTDSSKYYGWVLHKKYGDILKSLYDSKSVPPVHDGIPHGFDFTKAQAKLPRSKSNNVLFADLVALKVNIAASAYSVTTPGLGELVYDDGTSNPMNGKLVKEIAAYTDSAIIGYYQTGLHLYLPLTEFKAIDSAIANINSAFEGPLDTVSFSGTLLFKGVKRLVDVPFLHASPQNPPYIAHPVYQGLTEFPQQFTLYQNYPNPFNPTTTIQFDLPVQAYVTLRVYNLLGQVVATLIDHQLTSDGSQEVPFDGSRLASGVYFYRMTAEQTPQNGDGSASVAGGTVQMVRKMLLIK